MKRASEHAATPVPVSRREALERLTRWLALGGAPAVITACGGGEAAVPAPSVAAPPPSPSVERLKRAIGSARTLSVGDILLTVSQTPTNVSVPAAGTDAVILPTPEGTAVNPNPVSLAELTQVWGYHRETWFKQTAQLLGSAPGNLSWFVPVQVAHPAATLQSGGLCGLHFRHQGRAFEVLFAGHGTCMTVIADGQYATSRFITTALSNGVVGQPLDNFSSYVEIDFGSSASRQVSLYVYSTLGPCAIAIRAGDTISSWDRSGEPSMSSMADSYAGASSPHWSVGGYLFEAAALLGIPHVDFSGIGGTGYAPNTSSPDGLNRGNAFGARVAGMTQAPSDLFITAGGINDNNSLAEPPLYATAAEAKAGFDSSVAAYFQALRAALPQAVLAAVGPWLPNGSVRPQSARAKLDTIRAALESLPGPWVVIDNLEGGWRNSTGASTGPSGIGWQTGTGTESDPHGDGNGDLYLSADGTHPNEAGSTYLGLQLGLNLKAAILAL